VQFTNSDKQLVEMEMSDSSIPPLDQRPLFDLVQMGGGCWFALESEQGLVMSESAQNGNLLLIWTSYQLASERCQQVKGRPPLKVSQIDFRELSPLLTRMRDTGMQYVILDTKSGESPRGIPINELIQVIDQTIKKINTYRVEMDEFVRRLDALRKFGVPVHKEDEYLPIDCGNCGASFTVHEIGYRHWRSGENSDMLCPVCMSIFQEGRFGTVKCAICGAQSGTMPASLCERFGQPSHRWHCQQCHAREAEAALRSSFQQESNAQSPKAKPSGCIVVVLLVITVAFYSAFRF